VGEGEKREVGACREFERGMQWRQWSVWKEEAIETRTATPSQQGLAASAFGASRIKIMH